MDHPQAAMVRAMTLRFPPHLREDLFLEGMLAVIKCFKRFDEKRGVKFNTYAWYRVRGAMQDFCRRLSESPKKKDARKRGDCSAYFRAWRQRQKVLVA